MKQNRTLKINKNKITVLRDIPKKIWKQVENFKWETLFAYLDMRF